jgi:predicted RNA-binding protein associated with RNAse of E/G family
MIKQIVFEDEITLWWEKNEIAKNADNYKVFLDENNNPILYYFDIVKENGIDELTGTPYYIDMYTDIMIYTSDNKIVIVDEDELLDALNNGVISKEDFDITNQTTQKLYQELIQNINKFRNKDLTKYLK